VTLLNKTHAALLYENIRQPDSFAVTSFHKKHSFINSASHLSSPHSSTGTSVRNPRENRFNVCFKEFRCLLNKAMSY